MIRQFLKALGLVPIIITPLIISACATGMVDTTDQPATVSTAKHFTKDSAWTLQLPEAEHVVFNGVVSFDQAGIHGGSMLYPAPNAIGLVAAIITHGIVNESVRNSQKTKLQETADKVLEPYHAVLAEYGYKELMQRGLEMLPMAGGKKLVGHAENPGTGWRIASAPVFLMTQDQSALVLENTISIYAPGTTSEPVYQSPVRVVSQPRSDTNLTRFWTADNGKQLKEESAGLFAESMRIALSEAANTATPNNNAQKTFRYLVGKTEMMERGQLVSESCGRLLIKNLRGEPMSIPVRKDTAASSSDVQCGHVSTIGK